MIDKKRERNRIRIVPGPGQVYVRSVILRSAFADLKAKRKNVKFNLNQKQVFTKFTVI